jgi:3-oxoacyl-[acyl-carrier-protein] synthase-1
LSGLGAESFTALVCPLDHAGALIGLARALRLFESGPFRRVLVLAVDTLVDAPSIEWMVRCGDLQPDAPGGGVQPGEAAACLLFERDADASTAIIGLAVGATPERASLDAAAMSGREIGQTVGACLAASGLTRPFAGDIVADLTGASWRAKELGVAFSTLGPGHLAPATTLVLPCTSTGDTGSASAAVALAVASRALERGYARSATSLVVACSPSGAHGAAVVARTA